MTSLIGSNAQFSNTEAILGKIFQSTVEDVRESVNSLWTSAPAGEEPLTFYTSLCLVSKLRHSKGEICSKIHDDLCQICRTWSFDSNKVPNSHSLDNAVEVLVIPHNKWFEGKISGADFGLVLTVPVAFKVFNTFDLKTRSSGCIVQAKRIVATGTKRETSPLGKGFSRLKEHRDFALFALYCFRHDNNEKSYTFENTLFVPCKDFKANSLRSFKTAVKTFLTSDGQQSIRQIEAKDMVKGVLSNDFGTSNEERVQKIIGLSKLPVIEIRISFRPGWKPPNLVSTKAREVQKVQMRSQ